MTIIKSFNDINESDIRQLITNKVQENKTLEYKATLPDNTYEQKKEFLADVSSFANASGGHLLYGIRAKDGIPETIIGIPSTKTDAEILRLESMLQQGIEPRIPGLSIRPIVIDDSESILIIHVPRSWSKPHVAKHQSHWRFYSRNSAGKYPLDVGELRTAFSLSETLNEQIRRFRLERISSIIANETSVLLTPGGAITLHVIPIDTQDTTYDMDKVYEMRSNMQLLYSGWNYYKYNFDGFVIWSTGHDRLSNGYIQVFRNGIIEIVDLQLLNNRDERKIIPSHTYEDRLINFLPSYFAIQENLGIDGPKLVMLSLTGVKGYCMATSGMSFPNEIHSIDRDVLLVPDILVENGLHDPATTLRPAFDTIWNAAGYPRSMNFDKDGKWQK